MADTITIEVTESNEIITVEVASSDLAAYALKTELLANRVVVTQDNAIAVLGGTIDSDKEYFLDGIIDMGSTSIEVPAGGIYIRGYNFDISGLISTENNYTLFTSPVGGSGNILFNEFHIDISGTLSKVYDIFSDNGFKAIEVEKINFNNCTSLGEITNYRQGLETGTGRFGGTPNLILSGTWVGGYFIDTSIVRSLIDGTYSLFEEGTSFLMSSRFRTNMNVDLNSTVALLDFNSTNFVNPNTLQLTGCIVTRNGVSDSSDLTLVPNITQAELPSKWTENNGLPNTFVGGVANVTVEVETVINTINVPETLLGTFATSDLQHVDSPSNGQLRHTGDSPAEFDVSFDFILDGQQNSEYKIELVHNNGGSVVVFSQVRTINNLQGGRDVAYYSGGATVTLRENEYLYWQVSNITGAQNCTIELDSTWVVRER